MTAQDVAYLLEFCCPRRCQRAYEEMMTEAAEAEGCSTAALYRRTRLGLTSLRKILAA